MLQCMQEQRDQTFQLNLQKEVWHVSPLCLDTMTQMLSLLVYWVRKH